ncbi:acetyl-coenzyme A synthetase N-terminal domain-containing protein, partial [Marinicauda pacifica]
MDASSPKPASAPSLVPVSDTYVRDHARVTREVYEARYRRSIEDPDRFWREELGRLDWITTPQTISEVDWDP